MATAIIGYFRVSTKGQGESGLGLEAQRAAVEAYAKQSGATLVMAYTEVESGKLADRPELARALAHASGARRRWSSRSWTAWPGTSSFWPAC